MKDTANLSVALAEVQRSPGLPGGSRATFRRHWEQPAATVPERHLSSRCGEWAGVCAVRHGSYADG